MSLQRTEYFEDLLDDARTAVEQVGANPQEAAMLMAALISSDALNGIRKALLEVAEATRRAGRE